ncbi:hypothetical protein RFI_21640, partial [Reticulomyxa filosa]
EWYCQTQTQYDTQDIISLIYNNKDKDKDQAKNIYKRDYVEASEDRNQWLLHMCEVIYASERNKLEMKHRNNQSEYQLIYIQLNVHSDTFTTMFFFFFEKKFDWLRTCFYTQFFSQDLEATQGIDSVQKEILAKIQNIKLTETSQGIDFYSVLQLMSNSFTSKNANELHMLCSN